MVGFIKGIFGAKQKADIDIAPVPEVAPKLLKQKPQAFYLTSSDARTLGDIDYMQTAREIKRSFPKTAGGEELRTVSVVSSLQRSLAQKEQAIAAQRSQGAATPAASSTFAPQTPPVGGWTAPRADNPPKVKDPKERRRADSSLDTFRTMARDIQKSNGRKD